MSKEIFVDIIVSTKPEAFDGNADSFEEVQAYQEYLGSFEPRTIDTWTIVLDDDRKLLENLTQVYFAGDLETSYIEADGNYTVQAYTNKPWQADEIAGNIVRAIG